MTSSRQLAAILFADIEGYTALMQVDEQLALQCLERCRTQLEWWVNKYNGKILELRGDSALCSFQSTLDCIEAALSWQIDMQTSPVIPVRIGIHTGDVIIENNMIYGDGVNIASRLESFAIPGSILLTGKVFDDIKNQKKIRAVPLGWFSFKNVKDAIEVYAISHPSIQTPEASSLIGKGDKAGPKCILVLPFINLSREPDQEYFSDGLTEELISNLLHLKEVKVISRTTSMKYKGTDKDIRTIGQETGASYVIEGSVRKSGNHLRISSQLIDARQDTYLWSNTFLGSMDDIFNIQEKVASSIVDALRIKLTESEKDSLHKRSTENSGAYQLYLQGRYFWNKRNKDGLFTAIHYFEKAIEIDPGFALAWAGLADTYNLLGEFTTLSRREIFPKAKAAVMRALELDPKLAEAHISFGLLLMLGEWDWENAGKEFRIGLELNPNYATGHHWYAEWLLYTGHPEDAIRETEIAVDLDPVSQAILKDQGIAFYYTRQFDRSIEKAQKSLALDPNFAPAHRLLSLCYQAKGMFDEAIAENQKWGNLTGNEIKTKIALAQIYAAAGHQQDATALLKEVLADPKLTSNDCRGIAHIYAALQDKDHAFEWLEKSFEQNEESLMSIHLDPKFDTIRDDPRFDAFVKRLGVNSGHSKT